MIKVWSDESWDDYLFWQSQDRKTLRRANALIKDIERGDPFDGIGGPEPLRGDLSGCWSRRIDEKNRLVYRISGARAERRLEVVSCRGRYGNER